MHLKFEIEIKKWKNYVVVFLKEYGNLELLLFLSLFDE
jgi:hypothetical protein